MTIAICLSLHAKLLSFSATCFRDDRKSAKKQNKTYNILTTIDVSRMYYSPLRENWPPRSKQSICRSDDQTQQYDLQMSVGFSIRVRFVTKQ